MAADYTDGGGWAKLDQAACDRISEIVATFSPAYVAAHTRMLLTLYRSINGNGTLTIGYRTLADRAGVSVRAAETFVKKLEKDGILIRLGEVKTPTGRFIKRRFEWMGGSHVATLDPLTQNGVFTLDPSHVNTGVYVTHKKSTDFLEGGAASAAAAAAPKTTTEDYSEFPDFMSGMPCAADRR